MKCSRGALGSLGKIAALQSEISLIPIVCLGMPHYLETLRVYEARGFRASAAYTPSAARNILR